MQSIFYPNSLRKTRETISECNLFYFHRSECFAEAKSRGPKRTFRVASSALWAANREENQNRHSKECGIIQNLILSSDTVSTRFGISICVHFHPNPVLISRLHEPVSLIEPHSGQTENGFSKFSRREMTV